VTTRGFGEAEMREVGGLIAEVLLHIEDEAVLAGVAGKVAALTEGFPLYAWRRDCPKA
jgi:glycine hydroxymethyltransferase